MRIHRIPQILTGKLLTTIQESRWRRAVKLLTRDRRYDRIYHFHIRKTGGTSIVKMFHSLSGDEPEDVYKMLLAHDPRRIDVGGYVFVGWQKQLIEQGNYFHGFSHLPFDELTLPPNTFTFTCFRDPVDRVISHYRMLIQMREATERHPCFGTEGQWLGDSFRDFIDRIPDDHLLNQLFMFDTNYDINKALENVRTLDHWMFIEEFESGIESLNAQAQVKLPILHFRKGTVKFNPDDADRERLRERLAAEYEFLAAVRNLP